MKLRTVLIAAALTAGVQMTTAQQSRTHADKMMAAAQHQATVVGDLRVAIAQYRNIVETFKHDQAVAATALLRMADAHEKLGDGQAKRVYEQILRDYSDHPGAATTARARLAARQAPGTPAGVSLRRVFSGDAVDSVSSDGRWGSVVEWNKAKDGRTGADLAVVDLLSGAKRVIARRPEGSSSSYVDHSIISPDGRHVAYLYVDTPAFDFQIRIVPVDGSAPPRIVYRGGERYVWVKGWSPDGQKLLLEPQRDDATWQLAMLSTAGGALQSIKSLGWAQVNATLSPDGRHIAYDVTVGDGVTRDIFVLAVDGSQDVALVQHPANDSAPAWSADGGHVLFVSNRTRTSSLWAIPVKGGRPAGEAVLVKSDFPTGRPLGPAPPKTITRSGAVFFSVSGRETNVYHVALGSDGKAAGPPKIATNRSVNSDCCAAVSPDGKRLAYYSRLPEAALVIKDVDTGEEREYQLNLEINNLLHIGPTWSPDGRSVVVLGSVPQRRGSQLYRVDLTTGRWEPVSPDFFGAHGRPSPDGKFTVHAQNARRLVWHDLTNRASKVIREPDPNDSVFLSPTVSPDSRQIAYVEWRDGASGVSNIVVANTSGGDSRVVCRCRIRETPYNKLAWTPEQRYLIFADTPGTLSRVSVNGGEQERIGVSMDGNVQNPQVQPDGQGLYFNLTGGRDRYELWSLENFLPAPIGK